MRADSWPGLVTNASPFALPPGAAVEQTNLTSHIPGQMSARDGMRVVSSAQEAPAIVDCYQYSANGRTFLIALSQSGDLLALESPAYGPSTPQPTEGSLSSSGGSVQTNYTYRYANKDTTTPEPPPPQPPSSFSALSGVGAAGVSPTYYVDAMNPCSGPGKITSFDGGAAPPNPTTPTVPASGVCSL